MMKPKSVTFHIGAGLAVLCATLLAGCGTPSGYKQSDRTGEAINTVRNDIVNVKAAVDGSMKALDGLVAAASTDPRKPYEAFAKSVDKVEDASNTAKKDADEMRSRGAAYFQQWEIQINTLKSEEIRKLAQERRAQLQEIFGNIKNATEDTKQSFEPFLSDLKDLRTALGADLTVGGFDASKNIFLKTKNSGTEVQKNLDKLVTEMNSVVATLTAAKAQKEQQQKAAQEKAPAPAK